MSSIFLQQSSGVPLLGKSGVDGRWWLDGDCEQQGKLWEMVQSDLQRTQFCLWCFLGSEIDVAIWFHRPNRCLIVAYVRERTHDSSVLLKFSLMCSFYSFL